MKRSAAVITLLFLVLLVSCNSFATVLVIAPHPDDEALMFSGVLHGALQRGEDVKLVMATNGDFPGVSAGYARQIETVNAMAVLGLQEDDIIFLGYPDSGLKTIYDLSSGGSDAYTSIAGQTQTYGNRGLGRADYHTYRFGSPGRYNKVSIMADLESILGQYRPDHIFVTGPYDRHDDHAILFSYVRDALDVLRTRYPTIRPVVHRTVIHGGNDVVWPAKADPAVDFTEPPAGPGSSLPWGGRESLKVPPSMRLQSTADNLKHQAILRYTSQVNQYLLNFVHRDEVFWPENLYDSNTPPVANAGDDQVVPPGVRVTLNGQGSHDRDGDSLAYAWTQLQGSPVMLLDRFAAAPSFTAVESPVPLLFQLVVSDGRIASYPSTVAVLINHQGSLSVTTSVTGNGSIACTPGTTVYYNTLTSCTATPAPGSYIAEVVVDGSVQAIPDRTGFTWSFGVMTANHVMTARFVPESYQVTFLAGAGGAVTGSLLQSVDHGASTTAVTAVPATGYRFVGWTGTGGFAATANPLVMSNVTAPLTVTAGFARDSFAVEFRSAGNGTLEGELLQRVDSGGSTTAVRAVPAEGYVFAGWTGPNGFASTANPLTVTSVTGGMTLTAAFERRTFPVTFTSAGNGTLSGETSQTVVPGGATTGVTAVPATGYRFAQWTAPGGFTSSTNPLVFQPVTAATAITATFTRTTLTVTPVATAGGSLSPETPQTVSYGDPVRFTVVPAAGYVLAGASGCGGQLEGSSFTTAPVTADCSLTATFEPVRHPITWEITAGVGSAECSTPVLNGSSASCTVRPETGFHLSALTDNGAPVPSAAEGGTYVIGSVVAPHHLAATFTPEYFTIVDAIRVQQQVLGKVQLSDMEKIRLDVAPLGTDGTPHPDGILDVSDIVIVLRKLVGAIDW